MSLRIALDLEKSVFFLTTLAGKSLKIRMFHFEMLGFCCWQLSAEYPLEHGSGAPSGSNVLVGQ